jgi:hypothetical protein
MGWRARKVGFPAWATLLALLGSCQPSAALATYPTRFIDRPLTLPNGMRRLDFGAEASFRPNARRPEDEFGWLPLASFDWGIADRFMLEDLTTLVYDVHEGARYLATLETNLLPVAPGPNWVLTLFPSAGFRQRIILSDRFAADSGLRALALFHGEVLRGKILALPLGGHLQVVERVALSLEVTPMVQIGSVFGEPRLEDDVRLVMPMSVTAHVAAHCRWNMSGGYRRSAFGLEDGAIHLVFAEVTHLW